MAVTVRGFISANDGSTTNTTTAVFSLPAGAQVGDTAIFGTAENSSGTTYTVPSGSTLINGPDNCQNNLLSLVWKKDLVQADITAGTLTVTAASGGHFTGAGLVLVGTSASLITATTVNQDTTTASSYTSPAITVPSNNSMVFNIMITRGGPTPNFTPPAGFTHDGVTKGNASSGVNYVMEVAHKSNVSAGSAGGDVYTISPSGTGGNFYTFSAASASLNKVKVGSSSVVLKVGSTSVSAAYVGSTKVYP